MDCSEENSYMRESRMCPPSQIPTPGKALGLQEITQSENNTRAKPASRMPAPSNLKHKLSNYGEPEPKRKTLAQRAGEPLNQLTVTAAPSQRTGVKATSLIGAGKLSSATSIGSIRNPSFASSVSSRMVSSRNTSNGSSNFSSSIGPGHGRSASGHMGRPQSSVAFSHSTTNRPTSVATKSRPNTAMSNRSEESEIHNSGNRKGMQPEAPRSPFPSLQNTTAIRIQKMRPKMSLPCLNSPLPACNRREVSVSAAMNNLHLSGNGNSHPTPYQAIHAHMKPPPLRLNKHKTISNGLVDMRGQNSQNDFRGQYPQQALVICGSEDSLVATSPSKTPSHTPQFRANRTRRQAVPTTPTRPSRQKSPIKIDYLTKDSNIPAVLEWDVRGRLENMEVMYAEMKANMTGSTIERNGLEEAIAIFRQRVVDLELSKQQLSSANRTLESDLDVMREKATTLEKKLMNTTTTLDDQTRTHRLQIDDNDRMHRHELEKLRRDHSDETDRLFRAHRDELHDFERRASSKLENRTRDIEKKNEAVLTEERNRWVREVQDLEGQVAKGNQSQNQALEEKSREIQNMRGELEGIRAELDREGTMKADSQRSLTELTELMRKTSVETSSTITSLEGTVASLRARIHFLESGSKAQSDSFADMESRLQEAIKSAKESNHKLIKEETLRRILFNQVQELKGNIRVMCRVRPVPIDHNEGEVAEVKFPDIDKESKELQILGKEEKSSLGNVSRKTHAFTFDRVFGPETQNEEVFGEISQLVQSALDGYNVCIFCYGQTGSGKTHTMSSADGMIPRATKQIYETAENLKGKGWTYTMEGSFVEVYNEEIHDLLGNSKDLDKKKHEIRHDDQKKQTFVTGLKTVPLESAHTVESILNQASNNRSVAATKSNERSSRSHSVFILKLIGRNSTTNETSEGTLNLVDLAGSERLKSSGAEGDRMKETQNINKSLSCLGDVISALGQGKEGAHIPYRNSKLTYLLQYSLGGNSKTLMFVMASPMQAHVTETLTSLKFATKVHNTHIGTAKKSTKVRERSSE